MAKEWVIDRHFLDRKKTQWIYLLKRMGGESFMDACLRKDPDRAARIAVTAKRVLEYGLEWAIDSDTIKKIKGTKGPVAVFETRAGRRTIRVATYLHDNQIPIYLFDFTTHCGSHNNLPDNERDKADKMAQLAAQCARNYHFEGSGRQ